MEAINNESQMILRKNIYYECDVNGVPVVHHTWLSSWLSIFYDMIMEKKIFPAKFQADIERHGQILTESCRGIHNTKILEIGTGSGVSAEWLPPDNEYYGVDVSPGLLRQARKRFATRGFDRSALYVLDVKHMPFSSASFDLCLCILTLNFIEDGVALFHEISRLLKIGGRALICVPVPELLSDAGMKIRGRLRSEKELRQMTNDCGLRYRTIQVDNGALLYFDMLKAA